MVMDEATVRGFNNPDRGVEKRITRTTVDRGGAERKETI